MYRIGHTIIARKILPNYRNICHPQQRLQHYSKKSSRKQIKKKLTTSSSSSTTTKKKESSSSPSTVATTNNNATAAVESEQINAPSSLGRQDDGLSRYPNFNSPGGVLRGLDYAGTVTFALTGSVTAAQSGLDIFGCCVVGMVTAVGGGTIRDAVFLAKRPFWTFETEYIWMTVATAFVTFFMWPSVLEYKEEERRRLIQQDQDEKDKKEVSHYDTIDAVLDTLDSIGLAAFAIIGAQNGIRAGTSMVVSAICGMTTSTFGGLTVSDFVK